MKLQDNVRAVVVKEVQLRDPVTRSLRVRCTAAPAPAPAPVALPSTAHRPASGDHPPTSTRPPPTRTAIRAAAARRPTDYGARARAGGTCLVAVLHAASVIGCWRRAAGAASLRTAPDARCTPPPTPDDASRIQNIHKTPTQLPTYNDASRTRRTPPPPDDASRMQSRHKTCATSPGPGPIVII